MVSSLCCLVCIESPHILSAPSFQRRHAAYMKKLSQERGSFLLHCPSGVAAWEFQARLAANMSVVPLPTGEEDLSAEEDEEVLTLLYDPCLNCYFDPQTGKYYELV